MDEKFKFEELTKVESEEEEDTEETPEDILNGLHQFIKEDVSDESIYNFMSWEKSRFINDSSYISNKLHKDVLSLFQVVTDRVAMDAVVMCYFSTIEEKPTEDIEKDFVTLMHMVTSKMEEHLWDSVMDVLTEAKKKKPEDIIPMVSSELDYLLDGVIWETFDCIFEKVKDKSLCEEFMKRLDESDSPFVLLEAIEE